MPPVIPALNAIPGLLALCLAVHAYPAEIAAPYVPTAPSVVDRMLELARVGPDDFVIDLGSGDGRIVIAAAQKHGARGFGVEIDDKLIALANANARAAGVSDRVRFHNRDLFATDLSQASVVTIYLLTRSVIKLQPKLFALKPGTRIVSHAGSMGEWKPDRFEMLDVRDRVRPDAPGRTYLYLWTVPAKVEGHWRWSLPVASRTYGYNVEITQKFQNFTGMLKVNGRDIPFSAGTLAGERIAFSVTADIEGTALTHQFDGRVAGHTIVGTTLLTGGARRTEVEWKAIRTDKGEATR